MMADIRSISSCFLYDLTSNFTLQYPNLFGSWDLIQKYVIHQVQLISDFISGQPSHPSLLSKDISRYIVLSFAPRSKNRRKTTESFTSTRPIIASDFITGSYATQHPDPSKECLEPPIISYNKSGFEEERALVGLALCEWNKTDNYVTIKPVGCLGRCDLTPHSLLPKLIQSALDRVKIDAAAQGLREPEHILYISFGRTLTLAPFGVNLDDENQSNIVGMRRDLISDIFKDPLVNGILKGFCRIQISRWDVRMYGSSGFSRS